MSYIIILDDPDGVPLAWHDGSAAGWSTDHLRAMAFVWRVTAEARAWDLVRHRCPAQRRHVRVEESTHE